MLVRWNLERESREVVSRLGGASVDNLGVSGSLEYYACLFGDNSFKVMRFDNNKCLVDQSNLHLKAAKTVTIQALPTQATVLAGKQESLVAV